MESHNENLKDYVLMQILKGSSTLRLSNKGKKPFPKPIFQHGNQDKQIVEFLDNRRFILGFEKRYQKQMALSVIRLLRVDKKKKKAGWFLFDGTRKRH